MDILRDDLVAQTDQSFDCNLTLRERFLLDEGLEMLALYRSIGDPDIRLMVRQLLMAVSDGETREQ